MWISSCESVTLSFVFVRSFGHVSLISCQCCLFHLDTLLFPQSHQVFLPDLVHNTYLDHAILHNVHVVIKNDVGKVIRIVASKCIDRFSHQAILVVMIVVVVLVIVITIRGTVVFTTSIVVGFSLIDWAPLIIAIGGMDDTTICLIGIPMQALSEKREGRNGGRDIVKKIPLRRRVMDDTTVGDTLLELLHHPLFGLNRLVHVEEFVLQ